MNCRVAGEEARRFFSRTGLPHAALRKVCLLLSNQAGSRGDGGGVLHSCVMQRSIHSRLGGGRDVPELQGSHCPSSVLLTMCDLFQ